MVGQAEHATSLSAQTSIGVRPAWIPATRPRQRDKMALIPNRTPNTTPVTAPLVSVSPPALTTPISTFSKSRAWQAHHKATCMAFRV